MEPALAQRQTQPQGHACATWPCREAHTDGEEGQNGSPGGLQAPPGPSRPKGTPFEPATDGEEVQQGTPVLLEPLLWPRHLC